MALLVAMCLACAGRAVAGDLFDRTENTAVRDRPRPEYEALGVQAGSFLVFPKLTLGAAYNDNILATETNEVSDAIFTLQPQVDIESNWNVNKLSLTANGTFDQYATHADQDSDQYSVLAKGELDAYHDLTLSSSASYARILIPRAADVVFSVTPLLYDQSAAELGLVKEFNRLKLTAQGDFEHFTYENGLGTDGEPIDESFQNRNASTAELRFDYALSPEFALFLEEKVSASVYDNAKDRNRTSTDTLIGPNFEISNLMTGEIAVGYLTTTVNDPAAKPVGSFHGRAKLLYFPTQLITVTLTADRGVVDSGIPNSPAYVTTTAEAQADYELLRNLIITATVGGAWNDYLVIDKHDRYWDGKLSATYFANRAVGLELAYSHVARTSSGTGATGRLNDDVLSLAITLQR